VRLARRLLLYAAALVAVLVLFAAAAIRGRTADAARADTLRRLRAEAALAARGWAAADPTADPTADSTAHRAGPTTPPRPATRRSPTR
jgi:hypothetical protein